MMASSHLDAMPIQAGQRTAPRIGYVSLTLVVVVKQETQELRVITGWDSNALLVLP